MPEYKVPVRDMKFVREEVLDFPALWQRLPGCAEVTAELAGDIYAAVAKLCEEVVAPLWRSGDEEGCTWSPDGVRTPAGFREAYARYVEGGWPALTGPAEYGGQGLPPSLESVLNEFVGSANWAWSMYPFLAKGGRLTVTAHADAALKAQYLPKLISGEWTATMCLTESHAGTDLGLLRTKAEPVADGSHAANSHAANSHAAKSYRINGTKIFISSGEHDLVENIVHIVLARLPDAPPGTRGISLFLVPKRLPDADGNAGAANGVSCGAIEHKMGIHGNATAVIHFENATGFLLGEANRGLNAMFTFMNIARIGTAVQGVAHAELALQGAVRYARERLQMRALKGPANPDEPADPIIVHPDVRRMLLTIKAFAEGTRLLIQTLAYEVDRAYLAPTAEERQEAEDLLALLTPIAKGFCTEVGFEAASLGIQVFGGHGYIREWGMEQNLRDARIGMIYEGTNGIQAIDLLGRKVLASGGKALAPWLAQIAAFCRDCAGEAALAEFVAPLDELVAEWERITREIGARVRDNPDDMGGAAFDYLMYAGYASLAYLWARAARTAHRALAAGAGEREFYQAKLHTAAFYFRKILPRTRMHVAGIASGADTLMAMSAEAFLLD
ncbi:MAG TPA: acyl-CoA dehydrogenase C-terminal domain-containing protein [Porticoccaceae bacterium]|nr:acyl-CoA dehydrogenase C-terminal domain-containing protein [Porticoccaceae bacterium]